MSDSKSPTTERVVMPINIPLGPLEKTLRALLSKEDNNLLTIALTDVRILRDSAIAGMIAQVLRSSNA